MAALIDSFSKTTLTGSEANTKKKKRNIAIIGIFSVVVLTIAAFVYSTLQAPYVDYGIDIVPHFYPNEYNTVTVYYFDRGGRPVNFYLTMGFTNATFNNRTEQPYLQINSTTVRILLNKGWGSAVSNNRTIFFAIDSNTNSFTLDLFLERYEQNPVYLYSQAVSHLGYDWNKTSNRYELNASKVIVVGVAS